MNMTDDELLNTAGLCDALDIFDDGSVIVDLKTTGSEYRELWNNWKDHFFYLLSKRYAPANSGKADCSFSGDCIKVAPSNAKYAAAVIFSGRRLDSQSRNDKSLVSDYLEDGKSTEFADEALFKTGDRAYTYTDPQTELINDIMYCIEDVLTTSLSPLTVVECS